jgi:hypothetical protein
MGGGTVRGIGLPAKIRPPIKGAKHFPSNLTNVSSSRQRRLELDQDLVGEPDSYLGVGFWDCGGSGQWVADVVILRSAVTRVVNLECCPSWGARPVQLVRGCDGFSEGRIFSAESKWIPGGLG